MRRHSVGQSLWAASKWPQIEQGALTHFVAEAFGAHEAMGEIGPAGGGGAGLCAADEHGPERNGGRRVVQYHKYILWHYIDIQRQRINKLDENHSVNHASSPSITAKNVKDGLP